MTSEWGPLINSDWPERMETTFQGIQVVFFVCEMRSIYRYLLVAYTSIRWQTPSCCFLNFMEENLEHEGQVVGLTTSSVIHWQSEYVISTELHMCRWITKFCNIWEPKVFPTGNSWNRFMVVLVPWCVSFWHWGMSLTFHFISTGHSLSVLKVRSKTSAVGTRSQPGRCC